ncbi:hypothetical protein TNCV_3084021 [Trichonephila clavipes]|nr:hypothetical protein TNCV_3084021 [Trichonephila clavipes]
MSQQRDLPESMAWRVIGRLESGQTQRCRELLESPEVLLQVCGLDSKKRGVLGHRRGAGQPRTTTSTNDRYIQLTAHRNRTEKFYADAKTLALGNRTKGVQTNST